MHICLFCSNVTIFVYLTNFTFLLPTSLSYYLILLTVYLLLCHHLISQFTIGAQMENGELEDPHKDSRFTQSHVTASNYHQQ
jgi:hypothetical protein